MEVLDRVTPSARGRSLDVSPDGFGWLRRSDDVAGDVRAYDFMWLRHQPHTHGVEPHCDLVFMGRGTPDVLTCWTPFGDIAVGGGGLMLLEDSHRTSVVRLADYLRQDVDSYCENGPNADAVRSGHMQWEHWEAPAAGRE